MAEQNLPRNGLIDFAIHFCPVKSACLINDDERQETIPFGDPEKNVQYDIDFVGTGNPAQCRDEMQRLFKLDYTCFTFPCSFAGIYQPPFDKTKKFYATSVSSFHVTALVTSVASQLLKSVHWAVSPTETLSDLST